jgi:pyridoxamine 5'-phosphate oxidase
MPGRVQDGPVTTPEGDPEALDYTTARISYDAAALDEADLAPTPLAQFEHWYTAAVAHGIAEPNAMVIATVDVTGAPSTRTVLLKEADAEGFVFFSNYGSRKARDIFATAAVALTFPWHAMQRQVSARGIAQTLPRARTEEYFRSRPWASRIGAWASRQSEPVADRAELEARWAEFAQRWPDGGTADDVPVPDGWGGFVVRPVEVELWQGRASRLHDRLVYLAVDDGEPPALDDAAGWRVERRQP